MRKKLVLGTILLLSLLAVTIVASATLTFAAEQNSSINLYGTGGRVGFSVPRPGGNLAPGFPTDFNLYFWDFNRKSEPGAFDMMSIQTWAPGINITIAVGLIVDIPVPDWMKKYYNGTGLYYETDAGVIRNNIFQVTDEQLEVWMESSRTQHGCGNKGWNFASANTLTANLTVSVKITKLPSQWGLPDFTVDPMQVAFLEIGGGQYHEGAYFWYPGRITSTKGTVVIASFMAIMTGVGWGRGAPIQALAHMYTPGTVTYTLPP